METLNIPVTELMDLWVQNGFGGLMKLWNDGNVVLNRGGQIRIPDASNGPLTIVNQREWNALISRVLAQPQKTEEYSQRRYKQVGPDLFVLDDEPSPSDLKET